METKYKATFSHIVSAKDIKSPETLNISKASQEEFLRYVPYVDFERNADLLGLVFDVAIANVFNNNGDGICSNGSIKMANTLRHKPINIEHDRNTIIGHSLEADFTDRDFKKRLYSSDVKDKHVPFNITIGGVLYKVVAKELAEILSEIQKGEKTDLFVASSWEVGFESYYAAVGSKYLSECEIIKDQEEVKKLSPYMKAFGGKGLTKDGRMVSRLMNPEETIVFLGAGLTKYPAADVGQVYLFDYSELIDEKYPDSISHLKNSDVIDLGSQEDSEELDMKKEDIIKLVEEAVASSVKQKDGVEVSHEAIASSSAKIADAILESNKAFVKQKEDAEAKAKNAEVKASEQEKAISDLQAKHEETSKSLKDALDKISDFENKEKQALAKEAFNGRMSELDELFQLEDSDREVIAKQVSAIASDEEFKDFRANLEVIMSSKLKSKIKEEAEAKQKVINEAIASELKKRGIQNPLDDKEGKKQDLPNNSGQGSEGKETLAERFNKAFTKENVKVTI